MNNNNKHILRDMNSVVRIVKEAFEELRLVSFETVFGWQAK